ncbi:hypothetical protein MARGE09_P2900 [Marinagarivorans cellulosilyticus]|uniref:Amino acid permease n=1 Tax=Marinagarivorans cellulosilyticus TaxID=2721545 RepID=A0AAN1WJH3_9GAMM|nr:hypothetical protein MARGE09_P2900 [Marinagarivorans cellulosilyticus]
MGHCNTSMIGAGILALTGQIAEMTGPLFPLAFLAAGAYSYIKISSAYPSAGGIGMYIHIAYGHSLPTAFNALLMYFSMVIAQSFLARTCGSYSMPATITILTRKPRQNDT